MTANPRDTAPRLARRPEVERALFSALDQVPFDERTVLVLTFIDRLSVKEIAGALGVDRRTVVRRRDRGVARVFSQAADGEILTELRKVFRRLPPRIETAAVVEELKKLTPDLVSHLKRHSDSLHDLRPEVFEHLVGELLAQRGFRDVSLVGRDATTSADIRAIYYLDAINDEWPYFVEVKRWRARVGISVIDQVFGAMISEEPQWGWRAAIIVSLAGFSEFKKTTTMQLGTRSVVLRDKSDLLRWLGQYELKDGGLWLPNS
jgi:hypothetical protein